MKYKSRLWPVVVAATMVAIGGVTPAQAEERMTSYHAPTGAEMTPEAVTDLVVRRFARQDGACLEP